MKEEAQMDITRFINSKDIRKHLKDIGYKFNSLEAAWLIYQCRDATIKEKHKAWQELIETMPDCRIEQRHNTAPQESLHVFLREYMALEDRLASAFYEDADDGRKCVYQFEYLYQDGSTHKWDAVFGHFDALYESVMEPEEDVIAIECTRTEIDRLNAQQIACVTPEFELLRFDIVPLDEREDEIFWGVFDGLWFDFPTPFQKGDIVWEPNYRKGICAGPFAVKYICLDGIQSERIKENVRKRGDTSDMTASGYFLREDGSIYGESTWNYMDLEFYEKELTGAQRTLIAMSRFLKGDIDAELFARAYHQIITEGYAANSMPTDFYSETLKLAGLGG